MRHHGHPRSGKTEYCDICGNFVPVELFRAHREECLKKKGYHSHVVECPNCFGHFLEETDDCFSCPLADECEEESAKDDFDANEIDLDGES